MIDLPDIEKSFQYENDFYLSCGSSRIAKMLSQYDLYKKIIELPGEIVECGIFKGVSFKRFVTYRKLLENSDSRKVIGFDIFGEFPATNYEHDEIKRQKFIQEAGKNSIGKKQLIDILKQQGIYENIELIKGDINYTVPKYIKDHPELKISLLNLDTDIYEPARTILENLYPKIVKGGILMLDDYGVFPGETKAVDEYFKDKNVEIKKLALNKTPCYIVKNE